MDLDSLILYINNHKVLIVVFLLLIEQFAYYLPFKLVYKKGFIVGRYRVGKMSFQQGVNSVKGLKIKAEGDRLYIRQKLIPDYIPGYPPLLFIGYVKNQEDCFFYVKIGPVSFVLAIYFLIYQIYWNGGQGFLLIFYASLVAIAFYANLVLSVVLPFRRNDNVGNS